MNKNIAVQTMAVCTNRPRKRVNRGLGLGAIKKQQLLKKS